MNTIKANGQLIWLDRPLVMAIVNVTPDSFFAHSRVTHAKQIVDKVSDLIVQGADIVDVGAYSTRPGADVVPEEEEIRRLEYAFSAIRKEFPNAILSVDTFRSRVAETMVDKYGVAIVNDISGGNLDGEMYRTIGRLRVGYVVMHMLGSPGQMPSNPDYNDVVREVSLFLAKKVDQLTQMGVTDIIVDPGFGFGKSIDQNYQMMACLEQFKLFNFPLLVGVSRKSMIFKVLQGSPEESLNGTSVLNTVALMKGADILRVHDVREAVECIKLVQKLKFQ